MIIVSNFIFVFYMYLGILYVSDNFVKRETVKYYSSLTL